MAATISFEQLEDESAAAFEKFKIYRDLGIARRSLRAAYQIYVEQKEGTTKVGQKLGESRAKNVPGQWIRLAKKFNWYQRVNAFENARWKKQAEEYQAKLNAKTRDEVRDFYKRRGYI